MKTVDPFRNNPLVAAGRDETKRRRLPWIVSVLVHAAFVIALLVLPGRLAQEDAEPRTIDIVFYKPDVVRPLIPPPETPEPEPEPQPPVAEAPPAPEPVAIAEAPPRQPPPAPAPVVARSTPPPPVPRPLAQPEPPAPRETRQVALALPRPEPAQRKEPEVPKPEPRTGAFGAPPPDPGPAPPPERVVAEVGAFAAEPTAAPPAAPPPNRVVAAGSFGGGAVEVPREPDPQPRSVVTGAGFAQAAEPAPAPGPARAVSRVAFSDTASAAAQPARNTRAVNQGGFGAVEARPAASVPRSLPAEDLDAPVEIVSKPTPAYTEEARSLRIEGEVVLEVTFVDTGVVRVLRVLDGLGHGLDEAAIEAAKKIQFTPARRDGRPVDHTATLRVIFRLA